MLYFFYLCPCIKYSVLVLFLFNFFPSLSLPEAEADAVNARKLKSSREELYLGIVYTEEEAWAGGGGGSMEEMLRPILSSYASRSPSELRLLPIFSPLPRTLKLSWVESLLEVWRNKSVLGVLLFGAEHSGFGVTLAAQSLNIPVLWTTGQALNGYLEKTKIGTWEVRMSAGSGELLATLRSFLIVTHWHSFTIISTITPLSNPLLSLLRKPPLLPTIFQLRTDATQHAIFRVLTEVSRSTKGVVVLICSELMTKRILAESKRLNMADGDFVWIWVDTAARVSHPPLSPSASTASSASASSPSRHTDCDTPADKVNVILKEPQAKRSRPAGNGSGLTGNGSGHTGNETGNSAALPPEAPAIGAPDRNFTAPRSPTEPVSFAHSWKKEQRNGTARSRRWILNRKPDSTNSFYPSVNNLASQSLVDKRFNSSGRNASQGLPVGLLAIRPLPIKVNQMFVENCFRLMVSSFFSSLDAWCNASANGPSVHTCWQSTIKQPNSSLSYNFLNFFYGNLKSRTQSALRGSNDKSVILGDKNSMAARFQILNLVPEQPAQSLVDSNDTGETKKWRVVGEMVGDSDIRLDSLVWPGGQLVPDSTGKGARSVFRIVTAIAPPFVMEGELDEDGQCLRGLECHRILTSDKDNLTLVFNEMERIEEQEEQMDDKERERLEKMQDIWGFRQSNVFSNSRNKYVTNCCYGLTMDLLENVAEELEFDFHLYLVADGSYGTKIMKDGNSAWNGIVGDLVSGAAHMSFSALSVSSVRAEVIDFTAPYFFSGVSLLAAPKQRNDIPLLAFLLPFSPELWIAIFTSLHVTAVAVAIYEWLSPFGLNPWGRQRSKNFSMASALWVMWGLLCGHLVQFKAPKSWPNKFLINVWGGFSVIFVASYTANIAALIAGLFFQVAVGDYHDRNLLLQRVGAPWASAADYYVRRNNPQLWEHMQRYAVKTVAEGVHHLKNGSLDILIADTPILDYYRATDHGCKLQKIGDTINEDTYAVGMTKGFPLKDSVSAVIAKYSSNGYMDILTEKWYGGLPCFKLASDMAQPRPLGIAAVAGVFLLLGLGMAVGCVILFIEHLFYKHTLPILRQKPKGTIWRSRNIMFFSQKLYRFINCVELVSPHHAARELVHTLRQGQITSLFQKSVRREHEQRTRRKSKGQFFEMIQEIRRVQQEERKDYDGPGHNKSSPKKKHKRLNNNNRSPQLLLSPPDLMKQQRRLSPSRLDMARRLSKDFFRSKSSGNLTVRRLSSDMGVAGVGGGGAAGGGGKLLECQMSAVGRRLSHGYEENSPPDLNSRRSSQRIGESSANVSPQGSTTLPEAPPPEPEAPRSPNLLSPGFYFGSKLPPEPPRSPREVGPVAARRFTYDVSSPNFTKKFPTRAASDAAETPKVVINCDSSDKVRSRPEAERGVLQEGAEGETSLDRNNWSNVSDKSTEHMIKIFIPAGTRTEVEIPEEGQRSPPAEESTKPKIVSYVPKRVTRSTETEAGGSLERLSKEELVALCQLSESELKSKLYKALKSKGPT
nr:PREDICTED: uncharacterized protein LOC109044571 isoform X2 [Bemisia tabaci]